MPGTRQKTDAILAIGTNLVNLLQCLAVPPVVLANR